MRMTNWQRLATVLTIVVASCLTPSLAIPVSSKGGKQQQQSTTTVASVKSSSPKSSTQNDANLDKTLQQIADLVYDDKGDVARDAFLKLQDPVKVMPQLVSKLLEGGSMDQMVNFLATLDSKTQPCKLLSLAMNNLINDILGLKTGWEPEDSKSKVPLVGGGALIPFSQKFHKHCGEVAKKGEVVEAKETSNRFKLLIDQLIEGWALGIRKGRDFVQFAADSSDLSEYFAPLVQKAFGNNVNNFENVGQFVSRYEGVVYWKALGFSQLLKELQNNKVAGHSKEMLKFAYWISKDMSDEDKDFKRQEKGKEAENIYAEIKKQIPDSIQQLYWDGKCSLKNVQTGSYLQISADKKVLLKNEKGNSLWELKPFIPTNDIGEVLPGVRFEVKNVGSKVQLCVQTRNVTKGFVFKQTEEEGDLALCPTLEDSYPDKETTGNWVVDPTIYSSGNKGGTEVRAFRVVTGRMQGQAYGMYVGDKSTKQSAAKEALVAKIGSNTKTDASYLWQMDCK